jgi:hypothetical protein
MDDHAHLANTPLPHRVVRRPGDLAGQEADLDGPRRRAGGNHQDAALEAPGSRPGGQLRADHGLPLADQPTESHTRSEGRLVQDVSKHGPEPAPPGRIRSGREVGAHGPVLITSG